MSKKVVRIISVLLCFAFLLPFCPYVLTETHAAVMSLSDMQEKYPHGKFWNGGNSESYTSTPCTHHRNECTYNGSCGCNTYKNYAIQCMGFAFQLAYTAYGGEPYIQWNVSYDKNYIDTSLKPGDVIRYNFNGHSAFVYGVSGDTITYADCNYQNNCVIRWGATMTKSRLKESFTSVAIAPYSLAESHNHSYVSGYDSDHPHNQYNKCSSCGYYYYTGNSKTIPNCSECLGRPEVSFPNSIKAITLSGQDTVAYESVGGKAKPQKIGGNDICYITELLSNGWCKVTYPQSGGKNTQGYVKTSVFFNPDYNAFSIKADRLIETYARGDLKEEIGYTAQGDVSFIVDHNSVAAQLLYPVSGGYYRAAWIPLSALSLKINYNSNGGIGNMTGTTAKYSDILTLSPNTFTKVGNLFGGWNAYRNSDRTWYCAGVGWKTQEEINLFGYKKSVYKSGIGYTFNKSWFANATTNDTITFYPVWSPHKLIVYYNANGGTLKKDKHTLSNNMIYKVADGKKHNQVWTYGAKKSNGLNNASTFGLVRDGYTFKGWSTKPQGGTVFSQDDKNLLSSSINPNAVKGNCISVLYAVWESTAPKVTDVTVATKPITLYSVRQAFNSVGLTLTASYSDGTKKTITDGFQIKGFNSQAVGKQIVTIAFGGKETTLNVTVGATEDLNFKNCTHPTLSETILTNATCKNEGQVKSVCNQCGGIKLSNKETTPHTAVVVSTTPPTCTTPGKSEGLSCGVCGTVLEKQQIISALGHSYTEKITKKATMKSAGNLEKACSVCGNISNSTIRKIKSVKLSKTSYTYNGKSRKPTVTVKNTKGQKLIKGTDYTVKYSSGRKKIGEYKVTVNFRGKYKGKEVLTFKITPKATSLSKLTAKTKSIKVKWKKQEKDTSGYQLQYSTSKKFKNAKKITVKKTKTTSKTIKELKAKKTYYVRIRTFKTVKGKRIYSGWSKVKSKKTK